MHPRDKSKTVFMMELSSYCYKVMPFGLKNAETTYQRLMDRILAPTIGQNVQAHVDDMVVTSEEKDQHVAEIEPRKVCIWGRGREVPVEHESFGVSNQHEA